MMDQALKQRLIGASVIIALAVIFIPMLFDVEEKQGSQTISIELPEEPNDLIHKRIQLDREVTLDSDNKDSEEVNLSKPMVSVDVTDQQSQIIEVIENPVSENTSEIQNKDSDENTQLSQSSENQQTENENKEVATVQTDTGQPKVEPQKPEPQEQIASKESGYQYQVKLGSFSKVNNAQKLKSDIQQSGLSAHVYYDESKKLHTVVSHIMTQKNDAESYIVKLSKLKLNIGKPSIQSMTEEEADLMALQTANGFVVQMGSFSSKNNAIKFRNQLRDSGFVSFVDWVQNNEGENRYRVRVGPFIDEKDAKANQVKIKRVLKKDGLIKAHERRVVVE